MAEEAREWVGRLVAEHGRTVFSAAYRVTGNTDDAEDVLQTVFLRVLRESSPGAARNWGGYLRTMGTNAAVDLLRMRKRRREEALDGAVMPLVDDETRPDRAAQARQLADALRDALGQLPERDAQVFALRHFDDLTYEEIGEAVGVSPGNAGVILSRARTRLREILGPRFPGQASREHAHADA